MRLRAFFLAVVGFTASSALGVDAAEPVKPSPSSEPPLANRDLVIELVVVGVYRPVELSGRTVVVQREIYLEPREPTVKGLDELRGRVFPMYRRVAVPTALPLSRPGAVASAPPAPPTAAAVAVAPPAASVAPAPPTVAPAPPSAPRSPPSAHLMSAAERLAELRRRSAEPPSVAPPPPSVAPPPPSVAPPPPSVAPPPPSVAAPPPLPASIHVSKVEPESPIRRPRPQPPAAQTMEVEVGKVEIVDVRGNVLVGRVIQDALGPAGGGPAVPVELSAVMAGDILRWTLPVVPPPPPPPPVPPPPLTQDELNRLEALRRKASAESFRRRNPRGKYERKVMRWKL